jgi:hypothetical protein
MFPLFKQAEKYVSNYFSSMELNPFKATILVKDQRYILVRANSLTVEFYTLGKK